MKTSNGLYEAQILIRSRKPATEIEHQATTYIEGREGSEYTLRFINRSGTRVLVLPSVDGLSVLDGKPAGLQSSGYVVAPYQTVDIPGWKVDSSTAARFVFARRGSRSNDPSKQTYAEQQGADPSNIGCIGFAVFREKPKPVYVPPLPILWQYQPGYWGQPYNGYPGGIIPYTLTDGTAGLNQTFSELKASGSLMNSANVSNTLSTPFVGAVSTEASTRSVDPQQMTQSVGTGFGPATDFRTSTTDFIRENPTFPDTVFTFVYDSLEGLRRLGVPVELFRPKSSGRGARNPFPASPNLVDGGCNMPPGWNKRKRWSR